MGWAYDADRWAKRRSKFEIIKANECYFLRDINIQFLKYFARVDCREILQGEDCVRRIRGTEVALNRRLCRLIILNRGVDDGIKSGSFDRLFVSSNALPDRI